MTHKLPALRLVPGQELTYNSRPFKVDKVRNDVLYLDDQKSVVDLPIGNVPELFANGTLARAAKRLAPVDAEIEAKRREVEVSQLTEDERWEALRNLDYVNVLKAAPRGRRSGAALAKAIAEKAQELGDPKPPIERTVYRLRRLFMQAGGDIRVLVPFVKSRGCRKPRLSPVIEHIIDRRIRDSYLTRSEVPFSELVALIGADLTEENERRTEEDQLKAPHAATVRRRLEANFEPCEVMKARKGAAAADHHFRIVGRGPVYTRPLEMVQIDATQLDVVIVDPHDGRPIRPWITVVLDVYSRCILGFFASFAPPSRETTNQCLRHAFGYKGYLKDKYPSVQTGYPCFGVPNALSTDNGVEFKNSDVRLALASLGIDMHFNPAGKANYKGAIERFFRTLNERLIHRLPGTTRSNPQELGDYDPLKTATMTYGELLEALHICICDIYHNTRHRELGDTPLNVWLRGTQEHPIDPPPSDEELAILLGNTATPTVQRNGITLDRIVYRADWLKHLRPAPGGVNEALVRYDPSRLDCIWVYDRSDRQYYAVPAEESFQDYAKGLSWWEHQQVKKERSVENAMKVTGALLAQARREMHERFIGVDPKNRQDARLRRRVLGEVVADKKKAANSPTPPPRRPSDSLDADAGGLLDAGEKGKVEDTVRTIRELSSRPGQSRRARPKEGKGGEPAVNPPQNVTRRKATAWLPPIHQATSDLEACAGLAPENRPEPMEFDR